MYKSQPKPFDTKVAENCVVLIAACFKIRFSSNAVVLAMVIKLVFPRKSLREFPQFQSVFLGIVSLQLRREQNLTCSLTLRM